MFLRWLLLICALLPASAQADLVYRFEGTITLAQWNGLITPGMNVSGEIVWPERSPESSGSTWNVYRENAPPAAYWFSVAGLTFEADLSRTLELGIRNNSISPGTPLPGGGWSVYYHDSFSVHGTPLALPGVGSQSEAHLQLSLTQVVSDGGMPDFLESTAWPQVMDLSRTTQRDGSIMAYGLPSEDSFYAYFSVDRIELVQSVPEPGSIALVSVGLVAALMRKRSLRRR